MLVVPFDLGVFGGFLQPVDDVLAGDEVLVIVFEITILCLDGVAVLEGIVGGETIQGALADEVSVELAVVGRVDRDEDVGHDASTAVNGAPAVGLVFQRVGEVDAVGMVVFAVFEAFLHLLGIVLNAVFVGTLDATTRRRVVTRGGEADDGAVGQVERSLYQTFAEGTTADDDATVVVLDGPRENLAGRGRAFVDEDDEFAGGVKSVFLAPPFLTRRVYAFGEDDEFVFGEELVDELDGGVEVAARVAAQVEDERLHALCLQLGESLHELLVRLLREAVKLDVADMVVEHIGCVDAVQRNLVAGDFKINEFGVATALHADGDLGAFLAAQAFLHIVVVDLLAKGILAVDFDDLVTGHDADLLGGTSRRGTDDGDSVADELVGHADALEATHEGLVGLLHIFLRDVGRVRVEFLQRGDDGVFRHLVEVGGVNVEVLYQIKRGAQFLCVHLGFGLGLLGCHCHCDQAGDSQEKCSQ